MDYSWAIDSLLRADDLIDTVLGIDSQADSRADSHPADSTEDQPPLPAAWLG